MSFKASSNKAPKTGRTWNQNPQKSPPEGDLKTEPPKMVKNDPKLLPKGSQMETPRGVKNGSRGVRRTLSSRTCPHYGTHVLNWRSHAPQRHLFGMILGTTLVISWLSDGGPSFKFNMVSR